MTDQPSTYKCAACGGEFEKAWSDEEATAELAATFAVPVEECDIVCDDCYRAMTALLPPPQGPFLNC